jgi:hypothetical protein
MYIAVTERRIFQFPFLLCSLFIFFLFVSLLDRWNKGANKVYIYFGAVQIMNWFVGCYGIVKYYIRTLCDTSLGFELMLLLDVFLNSLAIVSCYPNKIMFYIS